MWTKQLADTSCLMIAVFWCNVDGVATAIDDTYNHEAHPNGFTFVDDPATLEAYVAHNEVLSEAEVANVPTPLA